MAEPSKLLIPLDVSRDGGLTVAQARWMAEGLGGKLRYIRKGDQRGWCIEFDTDKITAAIVASQLEGNPWTVLGSASKWEEAKRG